MRAHTILLICVTMAACGSENRERDELIAEAKAAVGEQLKDPESAKFSEIGVPRPGVVCGKVNGKNSYGAYSGAERFVYIGQTVADYRSRMKVGETGALLERKEQGYPTNDGWKPIDFYPVSEKYGC